MTIFTFSPPKTNARACRMCGLVRLGKGNGRSLRFVLSYTMQASCFMETVPCQ